MKAPIVKPAHITTACGDGNAMVTAIDWTSWTATTATGLATVRANNCDPDCADGTDLDYPVEVVLDRVTTNGSGPQFTRLVVVYQAKTPNVDNRQVDVDDLDVYSGG